ncbi:MAG TPA: hypothetical protein VE861_11410 [Gemmatimonadaceae bacterium]|nr:hypothetical protein [Gemmatimonadaceae bacterium]
MMFRRRSLVLPALALVLGACADSASPAFSTGPSPAPALDVDEEGIFHRFVSIGTSISMGWQGDGAIGTAQSQSWTAQLARLAGRDQTIPLIAFPGCRSPLASPLGTGVRLSTEGAGQNPLTLSCAPNEEGVTLPAQNVSVSSARTSDVLTATPESKAGSEYGPVYARVLAPGTTQLQAALSQKPKFISVELGGNEVLGARSGIAVPGVTMVPVAAWRPLFTQIADAVAHDVKRGILVGLVNDVADFPSFRRGEEIYADRFVLAALNVTVSANCDGSQNLIFAPVRIPTAVGTAAVYRARGLGAFTFSCADVPNTPDFVLTPTDVSVINTQLAAMNAHIESEASRIGFAYMPLDVLYGRSDIKPAYSTQALLGSAAPYGFAMSLDGIHPSQAGHTILAAAAARAINARYGTTFPETAAQIALR